MTDEPSSHDHPRSLWNQAALAWPQGDPYCCRTEWQLSLQDAYFPNRRLHLRATPSSLLALAERDYPDLGPTLEPIDSLWLFGCPLLGPDAVDLLDELLRARAAAGRPTTTLLSGILPNDALRPALLVRFQRRFRIYRVKTVHVCSASLEGGLDGYLARRSSRLRKRLRQATKRAARAGITFERCVARTPAESDALFARLLAVERGSWKGLALRGIDEPRSRAFYSAMSRRMAMAANGRVVFARAADRDVGFVFGGLAGALYRGQQFSYVEDLSALSLGNLLQQEQIRWLAEEGIARYDMGPLMEYKLHWAETRTPMEALLLRV